MKEKDPMGIIPDISKVDRKMELRCENQEDCCSRRQPQTLQAGLESRLSLGNQENRKHRGQS